MKVEIEKLTVTYTDNGHRLLALDGVDLALEPGRITALVGESGSGKTTLAKAVMGLLPENAGIEGAVRIGGEDIVGRDESFLNDIRWRKAAMVFQNGADNLNPVHRIADQVAEPLINERGEDHNNAAGKALELLRHMGLPEDCGRRYPHQLSGGQIQRALLAMSLILDPPILILDEPTAALDAMTKTFVAGVIKNLRDKGKAILLITHDLDLAAHTADHTAVLYLGQLMEHLPARNLLHHARHPYTFGLARSFPGMDAVRDLGGIRGDAFYRMVHTHNLENGTSHAHPHTRGPGAIHENGHAPLQGCLFHPRCTQAIAACGHTAVPWVENRGHRVRCLRGGIADLLAVKGVSKSYDGATALHPIDLTLRCGELFCLVGETGSGKTTLAMISAGALAPDTGGITFDERDMLDWMKKDYRSLAPEIGVIYQNPAQSVSHRLTVFEVVAEPLRIQNRRMEKSTVRRKVLAALSDARLSTDTEFLKRYPHELNMGAIQRVCLARALVHNPKLLIADEPTSALDPSVQAKVLKLLLNLQIEKGLTLLFISHDIGLARKIADRIGVMLAGRLVEVGPADRVVNQPGHPYTRLLIHSAKGLQPAAAVLPAAGNGTAAACPFVDRCDRCDEPCRLRAAAPANLDGGRHLAWCHRPIGSDTDRESCQGTIAQRLQTIME